MVSSYQRRINPVQRSLSRPLTILGAERKLFFFAMCLGAATFNLLNSLSGGVLIFLLLRFGLVASITTVFIVNSFNSITLGASLKTWYTPAGLASLCLLLGIAVYAFWRSLGGRELIGDNPT